MAILGAGDAGEMALRWIHMNPQMKYHPVGFIDPDPILTGRQIHGIRVLGVPADLPRLFTKRPIHGIILARPLDESSEAALREVCTANRWWLRRWRIEFEFMEINHG